MQLVKHNVAGLVSTNSRRVPRHAIRGLKWIGGFTLVEIMVVVGIIGIAMAIGIPSFARLINKKDGMGGALDVILTGMQNARKDAIMSGQDVYLTVNAESGRVSGGGYSEVIPRDVSIITMWVNFSEVPSDQDAKVLFRPNGTCSEFTMGVRAQNGDTRQIDLEVLTGLVNVVETRR